MNFQCQVPLIKSKRLREMQGKRTRMFQIVWLESKWKYYGIIWRVFCESKSIKSRCYTTVINQNGTRNVNDSVSTFSAYVPLCWGCQTKYLNMISSIGSRQDCIPSRKDRTHLDTGLHEEVAKRCRCLSVVYIVKEQIREAFQTNTREHGFDVKNRFKNLPCQFCGIRGYKDQNFEEKSPRETRRRDSRGVLRVNLK